MIKEGITGTYRLVRSPVETKYGINTRTKHKMKRALPSLGMTPNSWTNY